MPLDPELLPFLGGPATADLHDIAGSRARDRALTVDALRSRPAPPVGVTVVNRVVALAPESQVPIRIYRRVDASQPRGALLFIHGGAFVFGDLESEHDRCLHYATHTDVVVISVDYRLAPEFPYPAALEDVDLVLHWMVDNSAELGINPSRIGVGGASAGGSLAAGLVLRTLDRHGPVIAAQMLMYPVLDDRGVTPSMSAFEIYDPWDGQRSRQMWPLYLGHTGDAPTYAAPARAADVASLPTTFLMVCEEDPLRDEDLAFALRLIDAGVSVELHHYRETYHAFDVIAPTSAVARRALEEQAFFLQRALG